MDDPMYCLAIGLVLGGAWIAWGATLLALAVGPRPPEAPP